MKSLSFDFSHTLGLVQKNDLFSIGNELNSAVHILSNKTGPGNEFLGWDDLPEEMIAQLPVIEKAANRIIDQSEVLVVVGIGGSYLGSKSGVEALVHRHHNVLGKKQHGFPEIYFAGTNLSGQDLNNLMEVIGSKDFSMIVISKSGTTTEPAIAFRILKKMMEERYEKTESRNRIYAITDASKGALKSLARQEGYTTFTIPHNVGGRFSVLTAVGLLPLAAVGINVREMLEGAQRARLDSEHPFEYNPCLQYAGIRNILYRKGKMIELLVNYEPALIYVSEWWKQLFGESEGKEGKGIFPASVTFTADLHSMGQYIQEGKRHLFETILQVKQPALKMQVPFEENDGDGLNYLAGKSLNYINRMAMQGTLEAHVDGGVPNLIISLEKLDAFHLGYLFYFFEKACALSGYVLGVNPFDQPGVEAYKRNMFRLLGKGS